MSNVDDQPVVVMAWEGGALDGTEIAAIVTSAAATLAAEAFVERTTAGKPVRGKDMVRLAEAFVAHVVRWNRRDRDGRRLRVAVEAFLGMDRDLVWVVLRRWVALVYAPPAAPEPDVGVEDVPLPVPVEPTMEDLLEARTLHEPGPDEVLVERQEIPDMVDA